MSLFVTDSDFKLHTHKPYGEIKFNFHVIHYPPFYLPTLEFKVQLLAIVFSI